MSASHLKRFGSRYWRELMPDPSYVQHRRARAVLSLVGANSPLWLKLNVRFRMHTWLFVVMGVVATVSLSGCNVVRAVKQAKLLEPTGLAWSPSRSACMSPMTYLVLKFWDG